MKLNYDVVESPRLTNQYKEILDEFIKSGQSVVEVMDLPKGAKARSVYTRFWIVIREKGYPVKASRRKNRIFLTNKRDGDMQNETKL